MLLQGHLCGTQRRGLISAAGQKHVSLKLKMISLVEMCRGRIQAASKTKSRKGQPKHKEMGAGYQLKCCAKKCCSLSLYVKQATSTLSDMVTITMSGTL